MSKEQAFYDAADVVLNRAKHIGASVTLSPVDVAMMADDERVRHISNRLWHEIAATASQGKECFFDAQLTERPDPHRGIGVEYSVRGHWLTEGDWRTLQHAMLALISAARLEPSDMVEAEIVGGHRG